VAHIIITSQPIT